MDYSKSAEILKAIGHPVRLQILEGLSQNTGCNVNDMAEKLSIPQSTLSQHLAVLRNRSIIDFRKEGVRVCYRIIDGRILNMLDLFKVNTEN